MKNLVRKWAKRYIKRQFSRANITINGSQPWDIVINDERFYEHVAHGGSLALGETYMDGWWDCLHLDQFSFRLLRSGITRFMCQRLPDWWKEFSSRLLNRQAKRRAFAIGTHHYDIGNDLFSAMLDRSMTYSCGYWRFSENLDQAQQNKLALICLKLGLRPGMRFLDIGCGWGSLLHHATQHHGVIGVGVTVSQEQAKLAQEHCSGLPVSVRLQDYRSITERFDAIASVGMFEHVGYKNYPAFMATARQALKEEGLFLLHTIGSNRTSISCDPWFDKYIFPGGMLPSISQIGAAIEPYFIMEDWQNIGVDYEKTLLAWYRNFEQNWSRVRARYGERFFRMWRYYLLSLAGAFRARYIQVWQIVLSAKGSPHGYRSIRCPHCLT